MGFWLWLTSKLVTARSSSSPSPTPHATSLECPHDAAAGTKDTATVMAKMREMPIDDPLFGKGEIRADGRAIHDMYLFRVKSPDKSNGEWDLYDTVATIPATEAFRPMSEGGCPLVK